MYSNRASENLNPKSKTVGRKSATLPHDETANTAAEDVLKEPSFSDANFIIDLENIEYSLAINNPPTVLKTVEDDCIHQESVDHVDKFAASGNFHTLSTTYSILKEFFSK